MGSFRGGSTSGCDAQPNLGEDGRMSSSAQTPSAPRRLASEVTEAEFDDLVSDGLDLVPEELMDQLDNVVFLVEQEPRAEQGGGDLLGIYEGTPLTERDGWWASGSLPDAITIFRGPTLRHCEYADEVAEEVAVTVIHEIAHHFGIDDDQLDALGWA